MLLADIKLKYIQLSSRNWLGGEAPILVQIAFFAEQTQFQIAGNWIMDTSSTYGNARAVRRGRVLGVEQGVCGRKQWGKDFCEAW